MQRFFPSFRIDQLQDGSGRLFWRGQVQPTGQGGMVWDLMLIYKNSHPHAGQNEYGGSVQILPIKPRLKDIAERTMPLMIQTYGSYDAAAARGFGICKDRFAAPHRQTAHANMNSAWRRSPR